MEPAHTPMIPLVFFSHSSDDKERAQALVTALEAAGQIRTTFDVRDLRQGEAWRPQLYKWIAHCRGGILFLTANVMRRPAWVLQEATILRARALLEGPAFRLFVILDQEVLQDETWQRWFAPLELDSLQRFTLTGEASPLDAICTAVAESMRELADRSDDYLSRLARLIRDNLTAMSDRSSAVGALLSEKLAIPDAEWQRVVGPECALEALLAQRLCVGDFGHFGGIDAMFNELQGLCDSTPRLALLGRLRSYWIPLANASHLADAVSRLGPYAAGTAAPPNIVLVQCDDPAATDVADMYRERWFAAYFRLGTFVSIPAGAETAANLTDRTHAELQQRCSPRNPDIERAELVTTLAERLSRGQYTFVHIPSPKTADVVRDAAHAFWPCVFVLTVPKLCCAELADRLGTPALALPPDDPGEKWHLDAIDAARDYAHH